MELHTRTVNVTRHLQTFGILVGSKISSWSGTFTPPREFLGDEVSRAIAEGLSRQGPIVLVPQQELKGFAAIRARVDGYLRRIGHPFPLFNGAFFVMLSDIPEVQRFLREEICPEYQAELDAFIAKMPRIRQERMELFDSLYPEKAGFLADKYPDEQQIREKFRADCFMLNWAPPQLEQVAQEQIEEFERQTQDFVQELALDLRKTAVDACLAFKKALSTKSGDVNERAIEKFRNMLDRIERHNILGDNQMVSLIQRIRTNVFSVSNWSTETELKEQIKAHLDEVVEMGEDEGAAAAVASNFVRRVSSDDGEANDEIESEPIVAESVRRVNEPEPESEVVDKIDGDEDMLVNRIQTPEANTDDTQEA